MQEKERGRAGNWLALGCWTMLGLLIFFGIIGCVIFQKMKSNSTTIAPWPHTNETWVISEEEETNDGQIPLGKFLNQSDENTIAYVEGDFGKEYTPWWSVWDGFIKQYDKEWVAKKKQELIDELKKKHPDITDEEAELLIGDINIWGWKSVQIAENGVLKYGSKYFTNVKDLRTEFEKRTGTDAFTLIPKDKDGFIIPMNQEDYGYDLVETKKELDEKLAKSWDEDIKLLEEEIKAHWGEIYTPKPLHNLQDKNNTQRDVYFYQAVNNINNVMQNIISLNENILTEKDKEDINKIKYTFAKHWNLYRAYMVNMPAELAEKMGISNFDMLFYYADNSNNKATMKEQAIFGSFGNKKESGYYTKTTPNDNNFNTEKEFSFSYDDAEAEEAKKIADFALKVRVTTFPTQQANNITVHVLPDGEMKFGGDFLKCYTVWSDDETLQAKFAEGRHCITYDKNKQFKWIIKEKDTAINNSQYKDEPRLVAKTWYTEANKPTLSEEQKAQNEKVDNLYNKYYADEIKAKEEKNLKDKLETAKSQGFSSIEAYENAKKRNIEREKNAHYEYNEVFDHWKYFSVEDTSNERFMPTYKKSK